MNLLFHPVIETEVLVMGGGMAGIRAAIEARRRGVGVLISSASKVGYANNSAISYGGFNATVTDDERQDSPRRHYEDTLKGGYELNQPFLVRLLTERAWLEVEELERMGVVFRKNGAGKYVRLGRGGHSVPRRLATPRDSGMMILSPLLRYAQSLEVALLEGRKAVCLLYKDRQICGALLMDRTGQYYPIFAPSIILATGGGGAIYPRTTNVASATGDGYALAYRAGLPLQDMEFVQFILRSVREPGVPGRLPAIESLLLKGAKLVDAQGGDLKGPAQTGPVFTRDAVSQAVAWEIARNAGKQDFAHLDLTGLHREELNAIPGLEKKTLKIYPASHFFMGGIRVDENLCTPIHGLYAAGEVMGGVHGANRLGGNALAEALVFGSLAGSMAAQFVRESTPLLRADQVSKMAREMAGRLGGFPEERLAGVDRTLKSLVGDCGGVIRDKKKMVGGLRELESLRQAFSSGDLEKIRNPWVQFTLANELLVCEMILRSALLREETRGAHCREDFPLRSDKAWRGNILAEPGEKEQMKMTFEPAQGE